jgi:hypothetical protein
MDEEDSVLDPTETVPAGAHIPRRYGPRLGKAASARRKRWDNTGRKYGYAAKGFPWKTVDTRVIDATAPGDHHPSPSAPPHHL